MIRFSLACGQGHAFDGWFRSNEDFEQLGRKRVPLSHVPGVGEAADKAVLPKPGAIYQLTSDKGSVELVPFHEVGRGRYAVYFPVR